MARSRSLEVLQDIFPNRALISATDAGKAISLAPQTVKNQVSAGNFPIPTFSIGSKRICGLTDVADYIENIGKRPSRPREPSHLRFALNAFRRRKAPAAFPTCDPSAVSMANQPQHDNLRARCRDTRSA